MVFINKCHVHLKQNQKGKGKEDQNPSQNCGSGGKNVFGSEQYQQKFNSQTQVINCTYKVVPDIRNAPGCLPPHNSMEYFDNQEKVKGQQNHHKIDCNRFAVFLRHRVFKKPLVIGRIRNQFSVQSQPQNAPEQFRANNTTSSYFESAFFGQPTTATHLSAIQHFLLITK